MQKDHENVLKQKARDCHELKVAKELLEERLERSEAFKLDLETELDEKSLECHELKVTNDILQDKLQKAESEFTTVQENKDMLNEKVEFLAASVIRATEETLNMERKLTEAKKVIKKNKKESKILLKMLEEEKDKLQKDIKLSETQRKHDIHFKICFTCPGIDLSSSPTAYY